MSELDSEELAVLARARRGMSPSAGDAARVRAAVGATVSASESPFAARESARAPAPVETGMAGAAKLGLVAALAAATGLGGYALGFRAGWAEREERHPPLAAVPAVVVPPSVVTPPLATAAVPVRDPSLGVPQPLRAEKPERLAPSSNASTGSGAVPPSADARETSLELETRLLARVERALRDENPRLALGLLGELDRTVPGGQLTEERQAARAMGHCALGSETAPRLARGFVDAHSASAYVPRVREACSAALEKKDTP